MANKTIPELQESETPDVNTTFIPVDDGIQTKKLKLINLLRRPVMYRPDFTVSGGTLNIFQLLISIAHYQDDLGIDWWIADINLQFTFNPSWAGSHSGITVTIPGIEFDSIQGQPGQALVRHATGTDEGLTIAQPGDQLIIQHPSVSTVFGYSIQGQFNLFDKPTWYTEDGFRMREADFVGGGGNVDTVNNVGPDDFGNVDLTTDDIPEGATNKYFTAALAKTAAVANAINDGVNDVAPSQNAVFDALATINTSLSGKASTAYADAKVENALNNGVTDKAPSQDVVYDQIQSLILTINSKVVDSINEGVTDSAPSQNAVFDALATISTAVSGKADATATSTALGLRQLTSEKGNASGYAPLDTNARVPLVHLPSLKTFTYFANADFEDTANGATPAGWALYNDGAVATPIDATGGTATGVTLTASTTNPIRGTRSAVLSKDAANRQGCGGSYNITIAKPDRWKTEKLYIEIETSTNFVAGDVTMHLFDTTNNVWIPATAPAVPKLDGMGITISFDLTNSLTYRFAYHIATTNALAWDLKFDTLLLNGDNILGSKGPRGLFEEVNSYTVTASANPTPGAGAKYYRRTERDLDRAKIRFEFYQNAAGSDGTGVYQLPIPAGLTIDTSKIGVAANIATSGPTNKCGEGIMGINSAVVGCQAYVSSTTTISVTFDNQGASGTSWLGWGQGAGGMANGLVRFGIDVDLPILQWAGSVESAAAGNDPESATNTSTNTTTTDTTSFSSSADGYPIGNITAGLRRRVRFPTPITNVNDLLLLIKHPDTGVWMPMVGAIITYSGSDRPIAGFARFGGSASYGVGFFQNAGMPNTDIDVYFGQYSNTNFSTVGGAGDGWVQWATANWKVVKVNPLKPSGIYTARDGGGGFLRYYNKAIVPMTFAWNGSPAGGTGASVNVIVERINETVTITIPASRATSGTGSTAYQSQTALPAWARVPSDRFGGAALVDVNSITEGAVGVIRLLNNGIMWLQRPSGSPFANSNSNTGFASQLTFSYSVD